MSLALEFVLQVRAVLHKSILGECSQPLIGLLYLQSGLISELVSGSDLESRTVSGLDVRIMVGCSIA